MRSLLFITVLFIMTVGAAGQEAKQKEAYTPPWKEEYAFSPVRSVPFTVPCVDNIPDFHGDPVHARFVVFAGGNYFFSMDRLVQAFEQQNPVLKGKIFYETIPPGIVARQLETGAITVGNMTLSIKPDVVQAGAERIDELIARGMLEGPSRPFMKNRLAIMVPKENKAGVQSLTDLGRPGVRLANPNEETEGIAKKIKKALRKAGGDSLTDEVYKEKIGRGEAFLTEIHHRQTPMWILQGRVDAGVTRISEARYQERIGHPISHIDIPPEQNEEGIEAAAIVKGAAHRETALLWLDFLSSKRAAAILADYGIEVPMAG